MSVTGEELEKHSEQFKQAAAQWLDKNVFGLPSDTTNSASRQFVDLIVSVILMEITLMNVQANAALQNSKEYTKRGGTKTTEGN